MSINRMSKSHPYRIQLHCDEQMHKKVNRFALERGLSQSAAARLLVDQALAKESDELTNQLDGLYRISTAILHASVVSRLMASEAAKKSGADVSGEELKARVSKILKRYQQHEGVKL